MCLAKPAKIKSIHHDRAVVDFGGVSRDISLGVLSGVHVNDYVLVHAGFAIGKVKKEEAEETRKALREIAEIMKNEKF